MEFSPVVGHAHQKKLLTSLEEKEKFPHALLFSGPEGVGKRTMAIELIKNLFCEEGCGCGSCRPCRHLAAGIHPDLVLIKGETSIKIDELRALRKEVYERPFEARLRAIVMDNAELMTREAANALLKTLEEPPPSNLFILVTGREQEIPLTVRSRCMRIAFGPLSADELRSYFKKTLHVDDARAAQLSVISGGSIGSGLFWFDEGNFQLRHRLAELLIGPKRSFAATTLLAERMTDGGNEVQFLHFLLSFFRDVWWVGQTGETAGIANPDLRDIMEVKMVERVRWSQRCIERVQEALRTLRYNVNRWLALEHLLLNLMESA